MGDEREQEKFCLHGKGWALRHKSLVMDTRWNRAQSERQRLESRAAKNLRIRFKEGDVPVELNKDVFGAPAWTGVSYYVEHTNAGSGRVYLTGIDLGEFARDFPEAEADDGEASLKGIPVEAAPSESARIGVKFAQSQKKYYPVPMLAPLLKFRYSDDMIYAFSPYGSDGSVLADDGIERLYQEAVKENSLLPLVLLLLCFPNFLSK